MRTLLFDIDGTLLISDGGGRRAFEEAFRLEFGIATPDVNVSFSGRTDAGLIVELLLRNGVPAGPRERGRLRSRYASCLPVELVRCGGSVLPGVVELLTRLSADPRVQVAAMTGNLPETATRKLEHFELLRHFRFVVGGDLDTERDGLARRAAARILDRFGEPATRDVVVIGDTPDDIRCGHAIGASVIGVCTGRHTPDELAAERPAAIFSDLTDVPAVFSRLVDETADRSFF